MLVNHTNSVVQDINPPIYNFEKWHPSPSVSDEQTYTLGANLYAMASSDVQYIRKERRHSFSDCSPEKGLQNWATKISLEPQKQDQEWIQEINWSHYFHNCSILINYLTLSISQKLKEMTDNETLDRPFSDNCTKCSDSNKVYIPYNIPKLVFCLLYDHL